MSLEQLRTVAWYDRNPTAIRLNLSSTLVPHAAVSVGEYTVPKKRMAVLNLLYLSLLRETVATKVGALTHMYGNYTPKDDRPYGFVYVNLSKVNNIGDRAQIDVNPNVFMPEGDHIEFVSADDSTDGTVKFDFTLAGAEFDAYPIERPPFVPRLPEKDVQEPTEEKPWWWPF